jgi:hypothetical protein
VRGHAAATRRPVLCRYSGTDLDLIEDHYVGPAPGEL